MCCVCCGIFFFQAEDGIRDLVRSRGLGDVYKRQGLRTVVATRGARTRFRLADAGFDGKGVQAGMEEGRWFEIRDLIYEGRGA